MVKRRNLVCISMFLIFFCVSKGEDCALNCNAACAAVDGGCSTVCKPGYYGRKCQHPFQCYNGRGIDYRGTKNVTDNYVPCQAWSSQTPNPHSWTSVPSSYKNYCRRLNPDSSEKKPWCYQISGARYGYCDIPLCSYQCPAPKIELFGDIINPPEDGFAIGVKVNILTGCGPGTLGERTCLSDKTWSSESNCVDIRWCSEPTIKPNSTMLPSKEGYYYNASATITCDKGYETDGSNTIWCLADKTWSSIPDCNRIRCPLPILDSYSVIQNRSGDRYQDEIEIGCKFGYNIVGQKNLVCQHDKTWGPTVPKCEPVECPLSGPTEGMVIQEYKRSFVYEDTITVGCKIGYSLCGSTVFRCNGDASWNGTFPTCLFTGNGSSSSSSTIALVASIGSLAFLSLVINVILVIVIIRRRKRSSKQKKPSPGKGEVGPYLDLEMKEKQNEADNLTSIYDSIGPLYTNEQMTDLSSKFKLGNVVAYVHDKKNQTDYFKQQFKKLASAMPRSTAVALREANKLKNKHKNIHPYDDNRVVLGLQDNDPNSSYINASYVKNLHGSMRYIASQGPIHTTTVDFVRMIWEMKVGKIVILTNMQTDVQYWPSVEFESVTHGDLQITLTSEDVYSEFTIRQLSVSKGSTNSRQVIQYHFTAWPENSFPKYSSSLAEFRRKVARNTRVSHGPTIVHCSNGAGRTGTFIALDMIMGEARRSGEVDVVSCVQHLREQRMNMVQTEEQFEFLHDVLIEEYECDTLTLTASDFHATYRKLLATDRKTNVQNLEKVFYLLRNTSPILKENNYENLDLVVEKHQQDNRASKGIGNSSGLKAIYIPRYRDEHAFIITQMPLTAIVTDFLDLVAEQEVPCIVMLNELVDKACGVYWPQNGDFLRINDNYSVKILEETTKRKIKVSKLKIRCGKKTHVFTQLRALNWSDKQDIPDDTSLFLRILEYVDLLQRGETRQPVIVHCRNGWDKSGLLCCAIGIIDRLKLEGSVVIQHVIKQMRSRHPQIIKNMAQFDFCYKTVSTYLKENQ